MNPVVEKVRKRERINKKLALMAIQNDSPAEAEVAKAMLAKRRDTSVALTYDERLVIIAEDIKAEWGKTIEAQFAVGRRLSEARALFEGPSQDKAFGRWMKAQGFPFGQSYAWRLRTAYEREPEVRKFIEAHASSTGNEVGIGWALVQLNKKAEPEALPEKIDPVDPAYAALRTARNAILGPEDAPVNAFLTMHVEDLVKSAGFIKELASAYQAAKAERSA